MPDLSSLRARLKPHIPALLVFLLIASYVNVFLAVRYSDKLPEVPRDTRGLDVDRAWNDLHQITRRPHPYNSHENDVVRGYILNRLRHLSKQYPHIQYTSDASTQINTTYIDPPHSAYFESLNIIVLIPGLESELSPKGTGDKGGGVLYSAHIDSVASGVGATDDGVGVVCILGLIEYFAQHRAKRSVVFNLNDGEEDGLNGAMAYVIFLFFKHPWSTIPDTFVNFEGSGAGGRPIFFRSTSILPLQAATTNTHVHANVLSGDAFEHRLLRSRTDFTVYSKSLPAPAASVHLPTALSEKRTKPMQGIDLAFYKHRSYYHTKYDAIPYIEGGKKALWGMMDAGRGVGWELANRPFASADAEESTEGVKEEAWGDAPVFFDRASLPFLVLLEDVVLMIRCVQFLIVTSFCFHDPLAIAKKTPSGCPKSSSFISRALAGTCTLARTVCGLSSIAVSNEGVLFWKTLGWATLAEVGLAAAYALVNPFVVYGHAYQVLASFFLLNVVITGVCGYYHNPSTAPAPLPTAPSAPSHSAFASLLLTMYGLTYGFTIVATALLYAFGLGGTYFITIWGIAAWLALVTEATCVGGFTGLGVGANSSGHGAWFGFKDKEKGKEGGNDKGKEKSTEEPIELRRSIRKQIAIAAANEAALKASHTAQLTVPLSSLGGVNASVKDMTGYGVGEDDGEATIRTSPRKRARGAKPNSKAKEKGVHAPRKEMEVYVDVPPLSPTFSTGSASNSKPQANVVPEIRRTSPSPPPLVPVPIPASISPAQTSTVAQPTTDVVLPRLAVHRFIHIRILQLFLTVVVPVTLIAHISQVLVDGMSQTLADGSWGLIIYAALALFGTFMAIPAAPWILAAYLDARTASLNEANSTSAPTPTKKLRLIPKSKSKSSSSSTSTHPLSRRSSLSANTNTATSTAKRYSIIGTAVLALLVIVLHEVTVENLTRFPFNANTPLKVFFQQRVEFPLASMKGAPGGLSTLRLSGAGGDVPKVTTLLVGVPSYIRRIVDALPSSQGRDVRCEGMRDRKGTDGCTWDVAIGGGLVPSSGSGRAGAGGVDVAIGHWFDANVTRTGLLSARFEVQGVNTRNCRIYFEDKVIGFGVARDDVGGVVENGKALTHLDATSGFEMPEAGIGQLNLWSRKWGAKWIVDVTWPRSVLGVDMTAKEEKGKRGVRSGNERSFKGRVACEWSEYDSARAGQIFEDEKEAKEGSSIPAFEEVLAFAPRWVSVSKLYHGMLEVGRGWEI
ncbi:hypothetical protein CVT24_002605 [Panaeolus cyanescens]|uniref:Peptide hydrolase n=1 Tax=Panaeolus cyanescens TaxID=181874 RepID=A0A409YU01_9AGAR|nr:hypothetical protein CVT24_002605 [Panaeolus cyanescens]